MNITRFALSIPALLIYLGTTGVSSACSTPPTVTITYSWAPSSTVYVQTNNVPSGPVNTALTNWNNGIQTSGQMCFGPTFTTLSAGTGQTVTMSYGTIPPPSNCPTGATCVTRGITNLNTATIVAKRIYSVTMTINSVVTNTSAITEVVAHEFGHTLGLADCSYPGCPVNSSVMESGAPASTVNVLIGTQGPTVCDILAVMGVATDYLCPPPPPPPAPGTCAWDLEQGIQCPGKGGSPIILDIDRNGFHLTSAENGVQFDISGTGTPIQMGWTARGADDAFLALPGADGLVHNGKELFGNFTSQPPSKTPNGFAALAVYDDPKNGGNGDGIIDARDAIFASLRLWIDDNHDGICQSEELHTLPSLGVNSISLDYHESRRVDQYGNVFRYKSKIDPDDPDASQVGRIAYDVFFVVVDPAPKTNVAFAPANTHKHDVVRPGISGTL
jgi:hypothetical protein